MAEVNGPSFTQGGCTTAQGDRLVLSGLVGTEGVDDVPGGGLLVTLGSGLSVNVASGGAFISGDTVPNQGTYHVFNDGTKVLTAGSADPTDPRIDRIIARVYDAQYAGALSEWHLEVLPGSPSPAPVAPTLPANSISLAQVRVNAGATSLIAGNITDERVGYTLRASSAATPFLARYRSAALSVPNNTFTVLAFDTTDSGDPTKFSISGGAVTILVAGTYVISGGVGYVGNGTGRRGVRVTVNGTAVRSNTINSPGINSMDMVVSTPRQLVNGDIVRLEAFQDSGGSLALNLGLTETSMTVVRVGA